jgi:hypothetical protein
MTVTDCKFHATVDQPEFILQVPRYPRTGEFHVYASLCAPGMECTRNLTIDDLVDIREWIDQVIASRNDAPELDPDRLREDRDERAALAAQEKP